MPQTSGHFSTSHLSRGSQITHQEEKQRSQLGGSAISYGEKERVSSSGSPRTVKERFGNFLSAGHSPIGSASTSPREKKLKGGMSKSPGNSPREKPKRLGSLINLANQTALQFKTGDDKKILGPLLEKVLVYKNNLLEQKRVEKTQAEHERLERERLEQERVEQERIEQERKRAALSSIHKMGKFSAGKKISIGHLGEGTSSFLDLRNGGSTRS